MRKLWWIACGVGCALLSLTAGAFGGILLLGRGRKSAKIEEIESTVKLLLIFNKLAGVIRSFQDYLAEQSPANVLMHEGHAIVVFMLFARTKRLNNRRTLEGVEMLFIHDMAEVVENDEPPYDRTKLSVNLTERLAQLRRKRPPKDEESIEKRRRLHERDAATLRRLTDDLAPSIQEWALTRLRQFYLDETPQARLARECDRFSDAGFAPFYAAQGEEVGDFLRWARTRILDPDLKAAVEFLEPHFTPRREERNLA